MQSVCIFLSCLPQNELIRFYFWTNIGVKIYLKTIVLNNPSQRQECPQNFSLTIFCRIHDIITALYLNNDFNSKLYTVWEASEGINAFPVLYCVKPQYSYFSVPRGTEELVEMRHFDTQLQHQVTE